MAMKWSWLVGRFAGINVYIHITFFILIGWLALSHWIGNVVWSIF